VKIVRWIVLSDRAVIFTLRASLLFTGCNSHVDRISLSSISSNLSSRSYHSLHYLPARSSILPRTMTSPLRRGINGLHRHTHDLSAIGSSSRCFSTSTNVQAKPRRERQLNDPLSLRKMEHFNYDDVPTLGHLYLNRQRELLKYARILQWEVPKLSSFRREYQPPAKGDILRYRSHHYQGEAHPSSRKSVVTVQIADLFKSEKLTSSYAARKKLLLLAGVRWDATGEEFNYPDTESLEEAVLKYGIGQIKISCERFPEERMNLKWCSDTIDKLIEEANVSVRFEHVLRTFADSSSL
jgi:small subunit ribosomal protein S35